MGSALSGGQLQAGLHWIKMGANRLSADYSQQSQNMLIDLRIHVFITNVFIASTLRQFPIK
jgi:hypothetical protein